MPIYRQADGSYLINVSYTTPDGHHKQLTKRGKTIRKKSDAILIETQLRKKADELAAGFYMENSQSMSVKAAVYEYLKYSKSNVRASTLRHKTQSLRDYVASFFNDSHYTILENISALLKWRIWIDSYISKRTGRKLGAAMKNGIMKDLSCLITYLETYYNLNSRSFAKLERFKDNKGAIDHINYWTLDEFKKVDLAMQQMATTYKLKTTRILINTLFFTGMRKSEAYALLWSDIKPKENTYFLSINKGLTQKSKDENGRYIIGETKNRSSRRAFIVSNRVKVLLDELKALTLEQFDTVTADMFVFGGVEVISDTLLATFMDQAAKRAGVKHIKVHDLRHSFITLLINQNVNIKTIAALVGHASAKMTWDIYGHLYPDKENDAINTLNSLI